MKSISLLKRISCTLFLVLFYLGGPPQIKLFLPLAIIVAILFWVKESPKLIAYRSISYWGMTGYLIHFSSRQNIHLENLFIQTLFMLIGIYIGCIRQKELNKQASQIPILNET